jgi:hypothetical protein
MTLGIIQKRPDDPCHLVGQRDCGHLCGARPAGAFALVCLFGGEENLLIGARQGAPLAIGYGEGEVYLGSDALAPFTDRIAYLEESTVKNPETA